MSTIILVIKDNYTKKACLLGHAFYIQLKNQLLV